MIIGTKQLLFFTILTLTFLFRFSQLNGNFESTTPLELEEFSSKFENQRAYLSSQSLTLLPQPQASLLSGMVLGVKEDLPFDFRKALANTSTIHMIVVSGQNLTLLSGFIIGFSSLIGRKNASILSLTTIVFYALLTGLQVPVIRAAIMVSLTLLAQLFGREADGFKVLVMTALGMLIFNPSWLFSISFQLSFFATLGVVVIAPELAKQVKFLPDIIKQDLVVSTSAQLLTLPIIASNFYQISLVGILTNALLLWTVPFIMIWGAISILVSIISQPVAQILILASAVLLTFFINIVNFFNQKYAILYVGSFGLTFWIGYYLIIFGLYLGLKRLSNQRALNCSL